MNRILALIDFSTSTEELIRVAGEMAAVMNSRLVLLHVALPFTVCLDREPREHIRRATLAAAFRCRHRELRQLGEALQKRGVDVLPMMVRGRSMHKNPVGKINEIVDRISPSLILATPHRHSPWADIFTASVTRALGRNARCPVVLVPEGSTSPRRQTGLAAVE